MGKLIVSRDTVGDDVKGTADDSRVVVTFTFTQSVEFDGAELVGLRNGEIVDRARELVASQYDGRLISGLGGCGGASLLLCDSDVDIENMRGE